MPSSCQTTSKSKHYDFRTVCLTMTKGDKRSLLADGCCSTLQVYVFYIMYNEAVTGVANGIEDAPFRRTAGWCCLVVHTNEFHYNVVGWTIGKITFSRRSRMKSTTVITHKKKLSMLKDQVNIIITLRSVFSFLLVIFLVYAEFWIRAHIFA